MGQLGPPTTSATRAALPLRTYPDHLVTSQKCHDRLTHRSNPLRLLDHFVGADQERRWDFQVKRLGGLEVDDEFEA